MPRRISYHQKNRVWILFLMSRFAGIAPVMNPSFRSAHISTNRNLSLSLSNDKYFDIAYCFLWVNICHTIEGTFIPKYKAIVVIYYAAQRQLAWDTFGINSFRRIGYSIIVQCFQYFWPRCVTFSHQPDHIGKGHTGKHCNAAMTAESGIFLNKCRFIFPF